MKKTKQKTHHTRLLDGRQTEEGRREEVKVNLKCNLTLAISQNVLNWKLKLIYLKKHVELESKIVISVENLIFFIFIIIGNRASLFISPIIFSSFCFFRQLEDFYHKIHHVWTRWEREFHFQSDDVRTQWDQAICLTNRADNSFQEKSFFFSLTKMRSETSTQQKKKIKRQKKRVFSSHRCHETELINFYDPFVKFQEGRVMLEKPSNHKKHIFEKILRKWIKRVEELFSNLTQKSFWTFFFARASEGIFLRDFMIYLIF